MSLTFALGGTMLSPEPAHATAINPAGPVAYDVPVCQPWQQQFTIVPSCPAGSIIFYWLAGGPIPAFVTLDPNTGLLTACPDAASAGTSATFQVTCSEMMFFPFCIGSATADVTLNFKANAPCITDILPTFYPVAWEGLPFSMTLTAVGGAGTYSWSAAGLPVGLSVTDATNGVISGIPALGTCGIYTVTATVTDNGTCPACCPPVSRPFWLIVDCFANYLFPYITSSYDFVVQIGPGLASGQTSVFINGSQMASLSGGSSQTFTSPAGQYNQVTVDRSVQGYDSQTRYAVKGSNEFTVTDTSTLAFFDYAPEVMIQTGSDPGGVASPPGTGYYAVGGTFTSSAPSPVELGTQQGVRYLFRDWALPDGSRNVNRDLVFTVSRPGNVTAGYDTYYKLTIVSDYPALSQSSWELKGSTATYNVALQPIPIPNFWGVIGGIMRPMNASGTHVMNGPDTIKIEWIYDYTIPIIIIVVILLIIIGLVVFLVTRGKKTGTAAGIAPPPPPPPPPPPITETRTTPVVAAGEKKALTEGEPERPNFCPKCGSPVDKDAEFCKKCGNKLVK